MKGLKCENCGKIMTLIEKGEFEVIDKDIDNLPNEVKLILIYQCKKCNIEQPYEQFLTLHEEVSTYDKGENLETIYINEYKKNGCICYKLVSKIQDELKNNKWINKLYNQGIEYIRREYLGNVSLEKLDELIRYLHRSPHDGLPDLIILSKDKKEIFFHEIKTGRLRLRSLQKERKEYIEKLGFRVDIN